MSANSKKCRYILKWIIRYDIMRNQNQYRTVPFEQKSSSQSYKNYESSQRQMDEQFYLSHDSPIPRRIDQQDIINQDDIQEMLIKISQLTNQTLAQGQKLFYYEDLSKRLLIENEEINNKLKIFQLTKEREQQLQKSLQQFKEILQENQKEIKLKKDEILDLKREKEEEKFQLQLKLKRLEEQLKMKENIKVYEGKQNTSKNQECKKLQRRNRELKKINKLLEADLNESSIKILELQKEIQHGQCFELVSNLSRFRKSPRNSIFTQANEFNQKRLNQRKINRAYSVNKYVSDNLQRC